MTGLTELLAPLTDHEAIVESNRCLYCYDAPCTHACPTHIDIPRFIKKISTGNVTGSARAIFDSNLLGATCARVCPVQELCEGACVLGAEHKPISIGRLQRYAMDYSYRTGSGSPAAGFSTGRRVAVVGAGPAGLSCAGELARRGHSVTLFEKRDLGGGLSTFGIIALREPVDIALAEVGMIARLGVELRTGVEFGRDITLESLQQEYEAVFLATGLGMTPALGIPGEEHILDGLQFIEQSKVDLAGMNIGKEVLVIGAGNTAIDCATIAARLGASRVTMVYRRTANEMTAYPHEYKFVQNEGVGFEFLAQPVAVLAEAGRVTGLRCIRTTPQAQPVEGTEFTIPADQIVKAIGQQKHAANGLTMDRGFIQVSDTMQTSQPGIYAGGDCVRARGAASTVMAVQDGKLAAAAISHQLAERKN
jgi:glutamate synthase (NADPH/NADH) small chain